MRWYVGALLQPLLESTKVEDIASRFDKTIVYQKMDTASYSHFKHVSILEDDVRKCDENHEVIFEVRHQNIAELEKLVNEISDPENSKYGEHLSHDEVNALVRNPRGFHQVKNFLLAEGISITDENHEYVKANANRCDWEKIFNSKFSLFQHTDHEGKKTKIHRMKEYSLPIELVEHVTTVYNTVQFPSVIVQTGPVVMTNNNNNNNNTSNTATSLSAATGSVTPALLNSVYNIASNKGNNLASQAVYAALGEAISPSDLTAFQKLFSIPVQGISANYGGNVDNNACATACSEANLDVQYLMGVSQVTPTTFYYWGGSDL